MGDFTSIQFESSNSFFGDVQDAQGCVSHINSIKPNCLGIHGPIEEVFDVVENSHSVRGGMIPFPITPQAYLQLLQLLGGFVLKARLISPGE